jgi:hypothetical protein
MLKLVLADAIITCSAKPEKIYGTDVMGFTARVDFMGGCYKGLSNPNKYNGAAKDVEIQATSDVQAQTYNANEKRGAGAFVRPDIRLGAISSAKLTK